MNSNVLIKKELRESMPILIISLVIFSGFALMYPPLFDLVQKSLGAADLSNMPGFIKESVQSLKTFSSYSWNVWFLEIFHNYAPAVAIILGMSLIAGEVSGNTISFLLSKPFSRTKVYILKYLTGATILLAILELSTLVYYFSLSLSGKEYTFTLIDLLTGTLNTFAGLLVLYSLAGVLSVIFNERMKAGLFTGLIAVLLGLPGFFPDYKNFSLFYNITNTKIFLRNGFPWNSLLVFLVISILLLILGNQLFSRKQL